MAGPVAGNTFKVNYEFTNGNKFTGSAMVAAQSLEEAAALAVTPAGQALFQPPLPTNFTAFALVQVTRTEPGAMQVVIDETT